MVEKLSKDENISKRRLSILRDLDYLCTNKDSCGYNKNGFAPIDLGAWDASYHSNDLLAMCKMGLVKKMRRFACFSLTGSNRYMITEEGKKYLQKTMEDRKK